MEPETERTRRHLKKGRKRRRAPNKLVGVAEAKTACRKLKERQPEVKKACLSTILFAENCEVTHAGHEIPWVSILQFWANPVFLNSADIIGLQKKQTTGILSKSVEGSLLSASSKVSISLQKDLIIQNIVQFSFGLFSPTLTEKIKKRMRIKWAEMSTVYVGPFSKNCNLRLLKRLFKNFGPVQSMTLVLETIQPHLCIQFEVLEAAQLAIESMDGILVEGACIKVQRPVTELTLVTLF
ncbi:Rna Exonuclease 5 [Manis pentadactyla]|nr:Rna Exonuclease 5 [Manis pentadactyla]